MKVTSSSSGDVFAELARLQQEQRRGRRRQAESPEEESAPKDEVKAARKSEKETRRVEQQAAERQTSEAVQTTSDAATEVRSLAERYVAQYEHESGRTLSQEQRTTMVEEVADFYSSPSRAGRLERIVF